MFYKIAREIYYDQRWARSVLKRTNAQAVCFDYIMPRLYVVDAFLKAAREMSIPVLALPHGVQLYTNEISKPKSTETRRFAKFNRFDYIIAPNKLRKDILVKAGVAGDKISVLGSARYCRAWIEQNNEIVPKAAAKSSGSPEKLKVVLMPSKPQCRLDLERMFASCRLIAELTEIEAVIKPHTRTRKMDQFGNYPLPDVSHVLTADLCGWADVLLVVGSSVMTEALMRGKPVLYLKYLHDNTTLFEELGACWIIHNEFELKNALVSLQAKKADLPYSEKSVAAFLSEVVYGGNSNRDVLDAYEQFIVNCALSKRPTLA
jgi:UDP-N-acetylglucosamine 2-epimerase